MLDIFSKNIVLMILILSTVAAVTVRWTGLSHVSEDYTLFLSPWFERLKSGGGLAGLSQPVGDYYIPYLFLLSLMTYLPFSPLIMIKVTSIFFEFICAAAAMRLAGDIVGQKWSLTAVMVYIAVILSPLTILNGAFWGQCDYIYLAFILMSLHYVYKNKFNAAFILLGFAFAFKLQTLFIVPLYLLIYLLNRNFSIIRFLWLPAIYVCGGLPAVIAGRPVADVYGIYMRQTETYPSLSLNVPNIWRLFPRGEYETFAGMGIWAVIIVAAVMTAYLLKRSCRLDFRQMLLFGAVIEGCCLMFLPAMHERYMTGYCLLLTLYVVIYDRRKFLLALLPNVITLITYVYSLYGIDLINYYVILGIINVFTLIYVIKYALGMSLKAPPMLKQ